MTVTEVFLLGSRVDLLSKPFNSFGISMLVIKNATVSASTVIDLVDELIAREIIDELVLKAISPNVEKVFREHHAGQSIIEKRLSETDLLSLWEIAASLKYSPSLGFDIGQSVNINTKSMLTNWLSCCNNLKQALKIFHENIVQLNETESWLIKQEANYIKLNFKFKSKFTYPVIAVERSMVALIAWAEHFTSSKLKVQSANFDFEEPLHSNRYRALFGPNIHFNAGENSIEILDSELDKVILCSNPYLQELITEGSDNLPFKAEPVVSMQAKVQSLLKADVMTYCHLDAQLGMLRISKATLYKKLKQEGTSFTELVLKERLAILSKLQKVHTHYSNEESSEALGFKDVGSFYKFLKKTENLRT